MYAHSLQLGQSIGDELFAPKYNNDWLLLNGIRIKNSKFI